MFDFLKIKKVYNALKESCKIPQQPGRPTLSYTNAGPILKKKLASELANEKDHNTDLFMHAAAVSAKRQCNTNVALVLKETITGPEYTTELRKQLQLQTPSQLIPNEALAYILEINQTAICQH